MITTPTKEHAQKIIELLSYGLSSGLGEPKPGMMCVEAAVCYALGEPHSDTPSCVSPAVRALKIRLNDSPRWKSNQSRADGMRRLAIAQLGTNTFAYAGNVEFAKRVTKLAITTTVPFALRVAAETQKDPKHRNALKAAALRCEKEGTQDAAYAAADAAYAAYAAAAAAAAAAAVAAAYAAVADAAYAAAAAAAAAAVAVAPADAAYAAAYAYAGAYAAGAADAAAYAYAGAQHDPEQSLRAFAEGVVKILIDMGAPGTQWLDLVPAC